MQMMEEHLHRTPDNSYTEDSSTSANPGEVINWDPEDSEPDRGVANYRETNSCFSEEEIGSRTWNHSLSEFNNSNSNCLTNIGFPADSNCNENIMVTSDPNGISVPQQLDNAKSIICTSVPETSAEFDNFSKSTQTDCAEDSEEFQDDDTGCVQENQHPQKSRRNCTGTLPWKYQEMYDAEQKPWQCQDSKIPSVVSSFGNDHSCQDRNMHMDVRGLSNPSVNPKTFLYNSGLSSKVQNSPCVSVAEGCSSQTDRYFDSAEKEYESPQEFTKLLNLVNNVNNDGITIKIEPDPDDLEYSQAKQSNDWSVSQVRSENIEINPLSVTMTDSSHRISHGVTDRVNREDGERSPSNQQSCNFNDANDWASNNACLFTTIKVESLDDEFAEGDDNSKYKILSVNELCALSNSVRPIYPIGSVFAVQNAVPTTQNEIGDNSDDSDIERAGFIASSGGDSPLEEDGSSSKQLMFEIIGSNNDEESTGTCTCNYCSKDFSQPDDLVKHMSEHTEKTEDNKYRCKICEKLFKRKSAASLHAMIHLDNKHFPCAMCSKVFRTRRSLLTHLQCHSEQKTEILCKVCSSTFKSRKALKKHIVSEHDNFRFTCKKCYIQFNDDKALGEHICEKKPVKLYVCTVCSKSFNRGLSLKEHMWIHSDETKFHKPFICEQCPMCFRKKSHLVEHRRTHTGEKPFLCTSCPKAFSSKNALKRHLVIHTGNKPLLCDVCSRSFGSLGDFNVHKKIHTGEKPHSCHICSKKFRRKGDLNEHMRTHTGEKPYLCKICSKSYRRSQHLTDHIRTHSGEKPYICVVCTKAFVTSKELKRHTMTHTQAQNVQSISSEKLQAILSGQISAEALQAALNTETGLYNTDLLSSLQNEKPFKCETCCRSYRTQNALNRHNCSMQVEEEGEVSCSICSKTCSSSKALKRHMRCHRVEKNLVCSRCTETFTTRADLTEHIKTHIGEKSYACEVCSQTFKRRNHLKEHLNIHTGEKPFVCDICSMAFRRKGGLTEHQKSHTGERPFTCDVCLKSFARKDRMKKHIQKFHGIKTSWKCNICLEEFQHLADLKQHKVNHLDSEISEKRHVEILERNPTDLEMLQDESSSESDGEGCEMYSMQQPDDDDDKPSSASDNSVHSDAELEKYEASQQMDCYDRTTGADNQNYVNSSESEREDVYDEGDSSSDCSEDKSVEYQPSDEDMDDIESV